MLIGAPIRGVREFNRRLAAFPAELPSWPAVLGWVLVAFLDNVLRVHGYFPEMSWPAVVGIAALGAILVGGAGWALVTGGLYLHLGARIVGGCGSFAVTLKAVGYAYVWPCLVALTGVPLLLMWPPGAPPDLWLLVGTIALYLVPLLWGYFRALGAVRAVHQLSAWQLLGVALWLPVLLVVVLLAVAAALHGRPVTAAALGLVLVACIVLFKLRRPRPDSVYLVATRGGRALAVAGGSLVALLLLIQVIGFLMLMIFVLTQLR